MLDGHEVAGDARRTSLWRAAGTPAVGMRGVLAAGAKVAISVLFLWLALRGVDWSMVGDRLARIDARWGAAAELLLAVQLYVFARRWRLVAIASGAAMSVGQAVRYSFIGSFFGQTLPSTVGGDAARIWLLHRAGASLSGASYSVIIDRVIGLLMLSVFVLVTLPWAFSMLPQTAGRLSVLSIAAGCLLGVAGIAFYGAHGGDPPNLRFVQ